MIVAVSSRLIKVEGGKEAFLTTTLVTHHDDALPLIHVFQDMQDSTSRMSFSTESVGFGRPH